MNLSQNDLLKHIWVTTYETVIGFLLGTVLGIFIAILLWWSKFLSKVSEPFLVVLNSLPKVALRACYYNLGRSGDPCYYSDGCCNCDGGLMTTNTVEPANAYSTAKNWDFYDGQVLANLFSKLRKNEKFDEDIKMKVNRIPKEISKPELKDFAEQMIYFRNKLGYSQKQTAKAIGVSEDSYRRYELKQVKNLDIKKIQKIIKVLQFTEKPKVSEYTEFLMSNPEKMLKNFFARSGISKNAFAERAGINRRSILEWINKEKSISEESYYKIKKVMKEFQEENKEQIIEDEEEME